MRRPRSWCCSLLLWVLLGSWAAPLYLVGSSLLVVAAALGLTVYVFQDLLGYGELAFFVPVASAILLLALGADYNVFLISRIWREAEDQELRPAIRTAGIRAGRAITVAGLILALSFAAVALIPIQGFREIAFALCVGLLLDTLIARTLLVPALVAIFGRGGSRAETPGPAPEHTAAGAGRRSDLSYPTRTISRGQATENRPGDPTKLRSTARKQISHLPFPTAAQNAA